MNMYMIWPIALAVCSDIFYQVATKSTPANLNPFASLTITYLVGFGFSLIIFFITSKGGNYFNELTNINWTAFVLGLAIVGLEAGAIYMYKVGWNLNTGYIVKSCFLALALIIVGYLLYKEDVTMSKLAGIAVCMVGLFLINR